MIQVCEDDDEGYITFDGFEDALVGTTLAWHPDGSRVRRAVYDGERMVLSLVQREQMSEENARDFIGCNTEDAYVGPQTPLIFWPDHVEQ